MSSENFMKPFDDKEALAKNVAWLNQNMDESFQKAVSKPWIHIIANQLSLLNAHEKIDHLLSQNEACVMFTKADFDESLIPQMFPQFFIETFERYQSKAPFEDQGVLVIILLKLTKEFPKKEMFEPEEILSLGSNFQQMNLSLSTLCPHQFHERLFKLATFLKTKIQSLKCSATEYQDGFFIQSSFTLVTACPEDMLQESRFFLTSTFQHELIEKTFPLNLSFLIDAYAVMCHQILCQVSSDKFSSKKHRRNDLPLKRSD